MTDANPWRERKKALAKARSTFVIGALTYLIFILGAINHFFWHHHLLAGIVYGTAVALTGVTALLLVCFLILMVIIYLNRTDPVTREKFDLGIQLHFGRTTLLGLAKDTRLPILFALCGFMKMGLALLVMAFLGRTVYVLVNKSLPRPTTI